MRSYLTGALALMAFMCVAHSGVNSWSPRGPSGGAINDVAIDPTNSAVIYAGGSALSKSTDGGATWVRLSQDFGRFPITDVTFDPANAARLYVVSPGGGVFRSVNGGMSFIRLSALPTDANADGPAGFAISADGKTLYYTTLSGQFFRSTDSGATFTQPSVTPAVVQRLVVDPANGAVLYGAVGQNLIRSADGGDTWTSLPLPPGIAYANSIALVPGTPNTLWLATGSDVYSTQNDGLNWSLVTPSVPAEFLFSDVSSPGTLYATPTLEGGNVWKYSGGAWQLLSGRLPAIANVIAVSPGNSQIILAATTNGVFRTTNGGTSDWARSDSGLNGARVRTLATAAGRLYAGTEYGEIGIGASAGSLERKVVASNLTTSPSRTQVSAIAGHISNPNALIVGFNAAGYKYSPDGGGTWLNGSAYLDTAWMDAIAIDASNEMLVYAATRASTATPLDPFQRSVDGGLTFSPLISDLGNVRATRLAVDPKKSTRLFLSSQTSGTGVDGLLRSDDSGLTWTNLLENTPIFDFAIDPIDPKRIYATTEAALLVSENGGDTFIPSPSLSAAVPGTTSFLVAVDPLLPSVVYAVTVKSNGPFTAQGPEYFIMRSVDRGDSWERVPNSPMPNWSLMKIVVNETTQGFIDVATAESGVHSFEIAPDLAVSIVGHSATRPVGIPSSFDVKAQNLGPLAATKLRFAATFPPGSQNVSATIPKGSCVVGPTDVQCSLPFLKVNEVASAHVNYTPPAAGNLPVQASIAARENDPVASNNSATASATATESVDLVLTGSATPSAFDRGTAFSYTFQVRNAGPNASSATRLSIAAAAGVTLTSATPSACTVAAAAVNCDFGALANTATVAVTVNATTSASGTLRVTANASDNAAGSAEVDSANNAVNVDVTSREPQGSGGGGGGGSLSQDLLLALALMALWSARRRYLAELVRGHA